MKNDDRRPTAPRGECWRLQKDRREISCVVEPKRRGWELRVARSDSVARSVHLYPARSSAIFEAHRLVASYVGLGWTLENCDR
jgi:hypothetical protein